MSKLKLPIIIVVVLAALGGGLFASGMIGGKDPNEGKKHVIEPIPMQEPFTVLLADTDADHYAVLGVALQLEPMDAEHYATFSGAGGGGHGGATEAPGPGKVAAYPKFHDAINRVTSTFTIEKLRTPDGKSELKDALLKEFHVIAEVDEAAAKSGFQDPAHVGPPFHVMDVFFTKYIVK